MFTPHWVVRYMVENSLGRIWMTLHPDSALIKEMPYYIPTPEGQTDTIPEDIKSVTDIKFIDPCMGSGHVLVYAFDLFCKMYEEEGYQTREIPSLILTNNIYGIDIDHRCYQLASFALTMKARAYHSRYLRRAVLPNVIALKAIDRNVIESTGAWSAKSNMWQFENVDTIGSLLLIKPEECARIRVEEGLFGRAQQLLKTQAEFLSAKYHCVVTNPPYLGKGFCDVLKNYVNQTYPNSKADLYAAFIECLSDKVVAHGYTGLVTMESWMFLQSFESLRHYLLNNKTIISLSHFDWHIMRIAFGTVAFILQNRKNSYDKGVYSYLNRTDVDLQKELPYVFPKMDNGRYSIKSQSDFEKIPGCPIGYWVSDNIVDSFSGQRINSIGISDGQNITGDNNKYMRLFWEIDNIKLGQYRKWVPMAKGGDFRKWSGNIIDVVNWSEEAREEYRLNPVGRIQRENLWYRDGITWNLVSSAGTGFRYLPNNVLFNKAAPTIVLNKECLNIMPYALGFLNTKVVRSLLKLMNPTINTNIAEVFELPLRQENTETISELVKTNIALSNTDWDAHETSWDFKENELIRLVCKAAPQQLTDIVDSYKAIWTANFLKLHANEEELNRQFIEIYGLQDELTPDVPLEEVTILQKGEISIEDGEIVWHEDIVIKQLISYLVGCYMGRYSIDKPGLIIASQHQDLTTLGVKVEGVENGAEGRIEIDDDGVVPILAGEYFPDDMTVRIEQAIKLIFGEDNFQANLRYIDEKLGKPLREYLFKDFFNDHIDGKMYQKRPIYWMFSSKMGDKRKKGYFKALVYMHRMESDTLSKLHADYVVPYISKIEQQHIEAEDLSLRDDLSQAQRNRARKSAEEYADQIRELKEFEQVLVQMASQRLSIDLDDGVRVNYPKFYPLVEPIKGLDKSDE